jgi:hypothetical protein
MSVPDIELYYYDGANYTTFNAPIQSISISRGRSRQLNRFEAGSATINFYNGDRSLDPLNTSSGYAGVVVPRVKMKIFADSTEIFTGFVTDWDIDYDITEKDTATAYLTDELTIFSNVKFTEVVSTVEETPGPRIEGLLSFFGFTGPTNIDYGNANLGNFDIAFDTQLTDYFFKVAQSDGGNFFVAADGTVTFEARVGRLPVSELALADDTTGVGYSALTNAYGDELLFNRAAATSPTGTSVLENSTSITAFGLSVLSIDNLLNSNMTDLDAIVEDIIDKYGVPSVRFTGLQVQLAGLASADVEDILGLDLADQVSVKKSFSVGTPSSVTQDLIVTGIRHQIVPGSHLIQFAFEPTPYRDVLLLDDAVYGTLDDNDLG